MKDLGWIITDGNIGGPLCYILGYRSSDEDGNFDEIYYVDEQVSLDIGEVSEKDLDELRDSFRKYFAGEFHQEHPRNESSDPSDLSDHGPRNKSSEPVGTEVPTSPEAEFRPHRNQGSDLNREVNRELEQRNVNLAADRGQLTISDSIESEPTGPNLGEETEHSKIPPIDTSCRQHAAHEIHDDPDIQAAWKLWLDAHFKVFGSDYRVKRWDTPDIRRMTYLRSEHGSELVDNAITHMIFTWREERKKSGVPYPSVSLLSKHWSAIVEDMQATVDEKQPTEPCCSVTPNSRSCDSTENRLEDSPSNSPKEEFADPGFDELTPVKEPMSIVPYTESEARASDCAPATANVDDLPASIYEWPEVWREAYEERAGIMESEGGLGRSEVEKAAENHVRQFFRQNTKGGFEDQTDDSEI